MNYPANTVVITLSRPYKINDQDVTSLTMREPRVIDKLMHEKAAGGPVAKEVAMITSLCSLNPGDLNNLPSRDYDLLTEACNRFLEHQEEDLSDAS